MSDWYAVLGVSPEAEDVVIKAAYRALSQRYHPDKVNPGDRDEATRRMAMINRAYEILGDPAHRTAYDAERKAHFSSGTTEDQAGHAPAEQPAWSPSALSRRFTLLATAGLLIWVVGVERKSAWEFGWDLVTSGFSDQSHYHVHWMFIIVVLTISARLWKRLT